MVAALVSSVVRVVRALRPPPGSPTARPTTAPGAPGAWKPAAGVGTTAPPRSSAGAGTTPPPRSTAGPVVTPAAATGTASPPAGTPGAGTARPPAAAPWIEAAGPGAPDGYPVKVNARSGIYHLPGGRSYDRTKADRWYRSAVDAEADGFRASRSA